MGILSPIQSQFIKRPDSAKTDIVYKWPDENIRMHTQLTVQPDEVTLFVKEGEVKGVLGEGLHDLDGANFPFIGGLIDAATADNYFVSEIYFVSTKEFVNQLFGGPVDNVIDPPTELAIGLRCYGEFAMKAFDAKALILNLVGTTNISSQDAIRQWAGAQLLKEIREIVVSHIQSKDESLMWEVLGIASHTTELSDESIRKVNVDLGRYGIEITAIANVTINIDPNDAETLKQLRRDMVYGKNMSAADAALKLGAAKGFTEGVSNPGLFAAGLNIGSGVGSQAAIISCPNCQAQNQPGARFCSQCGLKLIK